MEQERVTSSTAFLQGARTLPAGFLAALPKLPSVFAVGGHRDIRVASGGAAARAKRQPTAPRAIHVLPTMRFSDVRVAAAESAADLEAAHELVRERYSWRGYNVDAGDRQAAEADTCTRPEITFLAVNREATLGTLTLRLDGPHGLRAEGAHGDVVQGVRVAGKRVCELTRLAVADGATSRAVLAALFNLAYAAADTLHGVTDVFIEVNPRHVAFYSRILGFVAVTGETFCERVRAPSVLLHVEMTALGGRLRGLARRASLPPVLVRVA